MPSRKSNKTPAPPPQRSADYLRARPWLPRQIGEAPTLALFWRDGPAGSRQGMIWVLSACNNPDCPCRDVYVHAISVPDSLLWVRPKGASIESAVAPDPNGLTAKFVNSVAFAAVDVQTGAVTAAKGKRSDAKLLAWLEQELDEAVVTMLRAAWNTARGRPADAGLPPAQP